MTSLLTLQYAEQIFTQLCGDNLRREDARLYSQHTRLQNGQAGLPSWAKLEASNRLSDAVALLTAGEVLRENSDERWRTCYKRCGELLEWLSHPDLNLNSYPIRSLCAAAYDVGGFPARANAVLNASENYEESRILKAFLGGRVAASLEHIREFWQNEIDRQQEGASEQKTFAEVMITEVVRSLSVVCSAIRWPDETRLSIALDKLQNISAIYASENEKYSWLLAKLVADVSKERTDHSWRALLAQFATSKRSIGPQVIDRYCRLAYLHDRSRAWPSQEEGIRRILSEDSFALCTPTGSGKTSIAEIALLDAISEKSGVEFSSSPLALYIVPSRALAAEVEGKLSRVLSRISERRVVVTGLYGGTDWGPTDAWLTSEESAVVICTYEKAEALLRFLGPLIVNRLNLVIFDEAHAVQFDDDFNTLRQCENRPLRLESIGIRLAQLIDRSRCRIVALSAVAAGLEDSLHRWASGSTSSKAVTVQYRSTRQLIGRLVVNAAGSISTYYDILDGMSLKFSTDGDATPYVRDAIPPSPRPPKKWRGPEKSLRPAILWAALHFSAPDKFERRHPVLISVTQGLAGFAKDILELLEDEWQDQLYPKARIKLSLEQEQLFAETLEVCEDYFGKDSYEYRLLNHGIAIHHSSMPKSLSRRVVDLINAQAVCIIVATSTLSEGINIPVETILVPSLFRSNLPLTASEFKNLAGRAGRPGVASEGRTLVVLPPPKAQHLDRGNRRYKDLLKEVLQVNPMVPESPLANAISDVWQQWKLFAKSDDYESFLDWLEKVSIQDATHSPNDTSSLDAIDSVLLAGIVEHEELLLTSDWEERIQGLWNASFASHLASEQQRVAFIRRGRAVPNVYPQRESRRQLYRTGLPPSTAYELIREFIKIESVLSQGNDYSLWTQERRFKYVVDAILAIGEIRRFQMKDDQNVWEKTLKWWLWPSASTFPPPNKIADFHKYVGTWFSYRCCWGLGSVIGYAYERVSSNELQPMSLDTWNEIGLPWIVFWLKELLSWGTLDPAAAFLLGQGIFFTRSKAESAAGQYYESELAFARTDPLDARSIRDWAEKSFPTSKHRDGESAPSRLKVAITDRRISNSTREFRVIPLVVKNSVFWADVGGYVLAELNEVTDVVLDLCSRYAFDFVLIPSESVVVVTPYL